MGKIQQVADPTRTYVVAYDNMGRLIGTTTQYTFLPGHNFSNTYTYDAGSHVNRSDTGAPATISWQTISWRRSALQRSALRRSALRPSTTIDFTTMRASRLIRSF